ncbi:MAG: SPFH domain-containing protein [Planctomycetota bacterium]
MNRTKEQRAFRMSGFLGLGLHMVLLAVAGLILYRMIPNDASPLEITGFIFMLLVNVVMLGGYVTVPPNTAKALVFLGTYTGSIREQGFYFVNPLTIKKTVSLRMRNFNSDQLKVNDARGNPVEIAAVIVWRVTDSAAALFDVDDYAEFVCIQSETALRGLATKYAYDSHEHDDEITLRANQIEVAAALKKEVEERLHIAGVDVMEARLSHLAYAPEIAQAMLRRQQAQAIIAARQQIVQGAVGMVQMALHELSEQNIVELDEEKKATMVNNLLVVLTSERDSQPVVNAGSIY